MVHSECPHGNQHSKKQRRRKGGRILCCRCSEPHPACLIFELRKVDIGIVFNANSSANDLRQIRKGILQERPRRILIQADGSIHFLVRRAVGQLHACKEIGRGVHEQEIEAHLILRPLPKPCGPRAGGRVVLAVRDEPVARLHNAADGGGVLHVEVPRMSFAKGLELRVPPDVLRPDLLACLVHVQPGRQHRKWPVHFLRTLPRALVPELGRARPRRQTDPHVAKRQHGRIVLPKGGRVEELEARLVLDGEVLWVLVVDLENDRGGRHYSPLLAKRHPDGLRQLQRLAPYSPERPERQAAPLHAIAVASNGPCYLLVTQLIRACVQNHVMHALRVVGDELRLCTNKVVLRV
mmetsp:Transcript_64933/g.159884  ORF Transcript_64933/g.159884 Transcript_64933/m.159884 type:complete len:351 (-) Transcript_64933:788-1840(-)